MSEQQKYYQDQQSIPIHLIRQWLYCPRVVYYQENGFLKDVIRPTWVGQGENFHLKEEQLWQRRNLSRFGLTKGDKYHQLHLKSSTYRLHGVVDMAIETKDAVYAAEFKMSIVAKKKKDILQLVAYAMLLEEKFGKPSTVGFLLGGGRVLHILTITKKLREQVLQTKNAILDSFVKGLKPETTANIHQCSTCEYFNFCNDRL